MMDRRGVTESSFLEKQYSSNRIWKKAARSIAKSPTGMIGLLLTLLVIGTALLAHQLEPFKPGQTSLAERLRPPSWYEGGMDKHVLGTDYLGRDILSRIIEGSRISLIVGICSVAFSGAIGMVLGLVSGYFGGIVDMAIMRIVDAFRTIPTILMVLVIAMVMGSGVFTVVFSIGVTTWTMYARIIRGEVLSIRQREYVLSARAAGAKNRRIIFTDIMPNIMSTFIVTCTGNVAQAIITESSLSFLGLGIVPPQLTWGSVLSDGRNYIVTAWWISAFPGLAICLTCLGITFFGDWLRDFLDPRINANA